MAKIVCNGLGIELHGKAGSAVFSMMKTGLVLRPRTMPRNPRTAAQMAARNRLALAAGAFRALTMPERDAWNRYAQTVTRFHSFGGPPYHPGPNSVFIGLASKFLQVNPGGVIPLNPPTAPFQGDGIQVTTAAGTGEIIFTASGPNSANVVTELLLQPLSGPGRSPKYNLYRPAAFVEFRLPILDYPVTVAPGWYAPAYRFVNAVTGQDAGLIALSKLQVG